MNLKPRLDPGQHAAKLLRRHRCTICHKPFVGHFAVRQCSDACRARSSNTWRSLSRGAFQDAIDARAADAEPLSDRSCPHAALEQRQRLNRPPLLWRFAKAAPSEGICRRRHRREW